MASSLSNNFLRLIFTLIIILLVYACELDSGITPEAHIEKARVFLEEGNFNAGVIELKNALQIESNLPEARWLLGKINLKLGNGNAAFKEITQAQSLGFENPGLESALLRAMQLQGKYQEILDNTFTTSAMSVETLLLRGNAYLGLKQYMDARSSFNRALAGSSSSIEARIGLAHIALVSKNLAEAEKIIAEAETVAPDELDVWMLKGQLSLLKNQPLEAEKAFSKAVSLASYNPVAQFALARAYLIQGKTEEALRPITAVETRYPSHPLSKYFRALIAFINEDRDQAKTLLQEVVKVIPNHAESLLLLSRIHYEEGQMEQAKEHISAFLASHPDHLPALKLLSVIELSLRQSDEAINTLNTAVKNAQEDGQVLALLGSAYMEGGNIEKGISLLEEAVQLDPDAASVRTQLAIGHLMVGETDIAVSELKSAIELDPDLMRADILLILAHIKSKRFDDAIKAAQAMADKQQGNPLPHNLLGAAYLGKNDDKSARDHFEQALSIEPAFTPALANLARLELKNRDELAAEKIFREILTIDTNNPQALVNLAALENQRNNIDAMLNLLERARQNNPEAVMPRIFLGKYYLEAGQYKKSLEVSDEAFELAPKHPEVLLLLGRAQRLNNDSDKSIETLNKLVKLRPDSHSGLFQLSLTQFQAGNFKLAKQNLNEILEVDPEHVGALIASARLALKEEEFELANNYLKRLRKTDHDKNESSLLEADILVAENKVEKAIVIYENALNNNKSSAVVTKLVSAHLQKGDELKAIEILQGWISEHPEDIKSETLLAAVYQQSKRNKNAIDIFKRILEKDPDSIIALNNLAWLNIETNPVLALKMAQRAYIQLPDRPEIADTLGWILIKQGNAEEGLAHIEVARSSLPDSPDIKYHYAAGLIFAGNLTRGRKELSALLAEHASFPARKEAEDLFKSLQ